LSNDAFDNEFNFDDDVMDADTIDTDADTVDDNHNDVDKMSTPE